MVGTTFLGPSVGWSSLHVKWYWTKSNFTWCYLNGGPCFYLIAWCASIVTKGCCMENSMWNWLNTMVLSGWKWESTQNWHWVSTLTMYSLPKKEINARTISDLIYGVQTSWAFLPWKLLFFRTSKITISCAWKYL